MSMISSSRLTARPVTTRAVWLAGCSRCARQSSLKVERVVTIANDITYKIGSFGPQEDQFFYLATQYARAHGLPRIYLSANSGARIGLAEEVMSLFSVAWNVTDQPDKGISYLYLTPENLVKLKSKGEGAAITTQIEVNGEVRHKITDIVGLQDGLGVECLKGSGLIAARHLALTMTSSRSPWSPLVLWVSVHTSFALGRGQSRSKVNQSSSLAPRRSTRSWVAKSTRRICSSAEPRIMHKNGVSHMTADSDLEGATHILQWLSFVPEVKGGSLPILATSDTWDRDIGYTPPKGPYDPRWFIDGKFDDNSEWLGGFFDQGSFQETLSGWAQTVVVGRARLGGIPMGVIAVETRTIERVVPADPANPASFEQRIMEAGQVWYPNSAYKTAQAIFDFNREGLPLMIFANWRGFSGGQQDMYDEVLKQGSKIVDGLSSYKQPVFVYIIAER